ncbi:MAG: electron transfer flavoprotein subunit alpha/FixB family protein [Alphaproteobacteria bacterium]|nr:electron transfer flavoprotein subunit alpha/FixB family protein [Alphaproteobacteria bacterium]
MKTLVIAEHQHNVLSPLTANCIEAAHKLSDACDVLLIGSNLDTLQKDISLLPAINTCLLVDAPALSHPIAEVYAPIIAEIAKEYDAVCMSNSTQTKDILPRVAGLMKTSPLTDVIEIIDTETFKRPIYAGNAIQKVRYQAKHKLISIRPTAFKPKAHKDPSTPAFKTVDVTLPQAKTTWVNMAAAISERPELTAAKIIVSGGRGVGSQENFKKIESLADRMGAAVGASRAAVDAGYVPNDYQVGQTGKIVAPDVYLCFGISGAIQHLAGMKDSQTIIAIDKDPDAPIFKVADYGYVGDLFEVIDLLQASMATS